MFDDIEFKICLDATDESNDTMLLMTCSGARIWNTIPVVDNELEQLWHLLNDRFADRA